jgi:acetyl-CoA carboxylase biotin carboxyl carrier protein
VGTQHFNYQELVDLIELIKSSSQFSEFRMRSGDIEIELRRGTAAAPFDETRPRSGAAMSTTRPDATRESTSASAESPQQKLPAEGVATPPAKSRAPLDLPAGSYVVASPMVGTVYRAPAPGAAHFVEVDQPVEAGATLCIVEVMKLMNTIGADRPGVVTDILIRDGEAVEAGQPLFVIAQR